MLNLLTPQLLCIDLGKGRRRKRYSLPAAMVTSVASEEKSEETG
jgi:hypothetical protein